MNKIINKRSLWQIIFLTLFVFFGIRSIPIITGVLIIMGLVFGPVFCGYACPYGFLQDLFYSLANKLGIRKRYIPKKIDKILKYIRYIILAVVSLYSISFVYLLLDYDPRSNFLNLILGREVAYLSIVIMVVFLLINLFYPRIFCRYFCFEGAKFSLLGIFRPYRIARNDTCINCKLCDKTCSMGIRVSTCNTVDDVKCISCFECTKVCPIDGCLKVELKVNYLSRIKKLLSKKESHLAIIVFSVIILSSFYISSDNNDLSSDDTINTVVIDNAENSPVLVKITDGVYSGEAEGYKGIIKTSVTVESGKIIKIEIIENSDDRKWFNRAISVIDEIINNQSTDVDTVTSATFSSAGIINSVKDALGEDSLIVVDSSKRKKH